MNYLYCLIYLVFSVLGLTFIKLGAIRTELNAISIPIIGIKLNRITILGYICYVCSFLIYTIVVTKFNLGVIIPVLSGLINIIIFIVAVVIFHEQFNIYSIAGIVFISFGVVLMNLKK